MAEVVKKKTKVEEYKIDIPTESTKEVKKEKQDFKKISKKNNTKKEKQGLWTKIRVFCNGVKAETKKVHWTSKEDMIKYSLATILFIVFCSLFFYLIDILFALVQSLFA